MCSSKYQIWGLVCADAKHNGTPETLCLRRSWKPGFIGEGLEGRRGGKWKGKLEKGKDGGAPLGGYSTGIWVGGFGRLNKTLTLFKTQRCKFFTLSKRKCCNFLPCSRLDQAGHIQNTKNGTRNQRKLCDRRGRKGGLGGPPCLRHENVKLYTLFKTENPENETLTVGTSLKRKYMGVPPPPPLEGEL